MDSRLRSLSQRYDGPQPSDLCDLLEGEQFFAGFERGLDVSTGVRLSLGGLFPFPLLLHSPLPSCREAGLRGGKALLRVLLQPGEPERGVHLRRRGSHGSCEGAGETRNHDVYCHIT